MTQPTLFELPPPTKVKPRQMREKRPTIAPDAMRVSWDGETYALDRNAIDALERECGPCENEDGVSLWHILRSIHANGARRVQFI